MYITMKKIAKIYPAKKVLRLLGQPHVLTLVHTFADGVWGFNQLQQVTGINSRTLTLRLQLLQEESIVSSVDCPKDARCRYYQLTTKGKKINKVVQQLDAV